MSFYGPLLWWFGAPATTASNHLALDLTCTDVHTGRQVFSKRYEASPYSDTSWIYALGNDFNYPAMLAEVYRQFADDLVRALPPPKSAASH